MPAGSRRAVIGSIEPGAFCGLDVARVYSEHGERPRAEVRWVYLARNTSADGDPAYGTPGADDEGGGTGDGTTAGNNATAPSAQRRLRPPGETVQRCPSEEPLGAHLRIRQEHEERHAGFYDCRADASFWFRLHSTMPGQWPGELGVVWKSGLVHYQLRNFGCRDVNDRATPSSTSARSPPAVKWPAASLPSGLPSTR